MPALSIAAALLCRLRGTSILQRARLCERIRGSPVVSLTRRGGAGRRRDRPPASGLPRLPGPAALLPHRRLPPAHDSDAYPAGTATRSSSPGWAAIRRLLRPLKLSDGSLDSPPTSHRPRAMADATALLLLRCAQTRRALWGCRSRAISSCP